MEKEGTYAPVEVNSDPSTPTCTCGALLGLISVLTELRNPQYVGNSRVLSPLCRGKGDISRGFVLIQDGGHRSCKDFWIHFATRNHSRWWMQVLTEICEIHFIVIQISASIDLGHGFKNANTIRFLLPMNFCFAAN